LLPLADTTITPLPLFADARAADIMLPPYGALMPPDEAFHGYATLFRRRFSIRYAA